MLARTDLTEVCRRLFTDIWRGVVLGIVGLLVHTLLPAVPGAYRLYRARQQTTAIIVDNKKYYSLYHLVLFGKSTRVSYGLASTRYDI